MNGSTFAKDRPLGWLRRLGGRLRRTAPTRRPRSLPLNLALQGGGAHGAFTWGVLDRLLEEPGLTVEGISGASAGAMNAVVAASGLLRGGREGARESLHRFWSGVGHAAGMGPLQPTPADYLLSGWNRDWSPSYLLARTLSMVASPYQLNPTGFNPLTGILEEVVDFDRLREAREVRVFVSMTNVHSGKLRVVGNRGLSPQVLAASACLPFAFQAVEIDGEHYWDGGYTANPALYPLIFECSARDLLLVQLNPVWREQVPTRVGEIVDRVNEIAFNANLMRELQMLALFQNHARPDHGHRRYRRRLDALKLHHIDPEGALENLGRSSPMNSEWPFLKHLRDLGRERAERWLSGHGHALGFASSVSLNEFL